MKSSLRALASIFVLLLAGLFLLRTQDSLIAAPEAEGQPKQPQATTFYASEPVVPSLSPAVRDLATIPYEPQLQREINPLHNPHQFSPDMGLTGSNTTGQDLLAANSVNSGRTPSPLFQFEGIASLGDLTPPDTNGDVGPNHYILMVNVRFAIYDKSGNLLVGPVNNNSLWTGFGGACESNNDGDPVVLYDDLADRWVLSQFAPFSNIQCMAVSQTADPTGAYYRYAFSTPDFPDYPKLGVWPNAYYMGTNSGFPNAYYAFAMDRVNMLAGNPATIQAFGGYPNFMMPADIDGPVGPDSNAPGVFYTFLDGDYPDHPVSEDVIRLYEFDPDFVTPANSTFTALPDIPIAAFNYTVCGFFVQDCIPQPGISQEIDSLSYWPMARFAYRNFNSYETLVGNFTVDVTGADQAGIRWFELRDEGAGWDLYQEGTYAPDAQHRFMGSIAMDGSGNIALGYSLSSTTTNPSIRYATRLRTDPLGTLQAEENAITGGRQMSGATRWGDYSSVSVDPSDNCTFWYAQEYHDVDASAFDWNTRIVVFRIPECSGTLGPDFSLSADPETLDICEPDPAVYNLTLGYYSGFASQVTLSASGVPAGYSASISPNPVITPTTSSVLTLSNVGNATAGSYDIDIVGVAVPTPTHTTTVQLNIYDATPGSVVLTAPPDADTDVVLNPTFTWNAATQGATYDLEVATDSGFTNVIYTATGIVGTSHAANSNLDPLTTYYWHVRANNTCGTGSYSTAFSFTTRDIPPVLLVDDDDNGPDVRSYYTDALDANGVFYDVWDTNGTDTEPDLATLSQYDAVIWFTGVSFGGTAGPGSVSETALASYLDAGKCMFISSQDYLFDRGITPFMDDYLGVSTASSDVGQTTVTGVGSVFGGLGPYSLSFPFTNWSDFISPDGSPAELAFSGDVGDAAVNKDSGVYRTTFWGFPFEAIASATDRQTTMLTVLNFCGAGVDVGTLEGQVTDLDSGFGIEGATISADDGNFVRTATTDGDGNYTMILAVGTYDVTAEADNYVPETVNGITIITDTTTTQNFVLQGSLLEYSPASIEEFMEIGDVVTNTVTLTATGPLPVDFTVNIGNYEGPGLVIGNRSVTALQPISTASVPVVGPDQANAMTTAGLNLPQAAPAAPLAAGDVINSWAVSGLPAAWGVSFDGANVWLSSPGVNWGGNATIANYAANGTPGGTSYPYTWSPANGPADVTYNWNTGMLWVMDVGQDNCIHEVAPSSGVTGNTICPSFSTSQRGLAYDPATDTYLAGGWNDLTIYRFASDGTILEQVSVGLSIAGLAYNPETMHLFVMVNASPNPVVVLDAANNYSVVGQFNVSQGFGDFSGAGLEFDCDGNLWAVDQATQTSYLVESGETASFCGIPWAYAEPDSGTVPANSVTTFEVIFDANSLYEVGTYTAELSLDGTFVNELPAMPLTMHLSCPTCGFLEGAITDAFTELPLEASINITDGTSINLNLTGDTYAVAVPAGTYDIYVSADGYFDESATVTATVGVTETTDFALTPIVALAETSATSFEETVALGSIESTELVISNVGTISFDFELSDIEVGSPAQISIPASDGNFVRGTAPASMERAPVANEASAGGTGTLQLLGGATAYGVEFFSTQFVSFDTATPGTLTNITSMGQSFFAGDFINGDFSTLYALDYDTNSLYSIDTATGTTTFIASSVPNGGEVWTGMAGDSSSGTMYAASTSCGGSTLYEIDLSNGALTTIGTQPGTCVIGIAANAAGEMYGLDILSDNLLAIDTTNGTPTTIGSVGFDANFAQGMDFDEDADILYLAAYNNGSGTGELRIADVNTGNSVLVGLIGSGASELDSFGIATGGASDALWLIEEPITGTVDAGEGFPVSLVLDTTVLTQTGTYTANLNVNGSFSNDIEPIVVVLHVVEPTYGVSVAPDMEASGNTGTTVTYTVSITNTGTAADTYDLVLSGHSWGTTMSHSSITIDGGESTEVTVWVEVPADAGDGDMDMVMLTVTSQGDGTVTGTTHITTTAIADSYIIYLPVVMKP